MPTLEDGTILPSFLAVERTPAMGDGGNFDNYRLRLGEVQAVVYPQDAASRSKRFVEYSVLVQQRGRSAGAARVYPSCLLLNPFSGLADRARWILRENKGQDVDKTGLGKGSKVLVLCLNGETNHAYIVGGTRDPADDDRDAKGLGVHMLGTFNGVQVLVDQDGQLSLTYGGKTGIDGKVDSSVDTKAPGTSLQLLKDGSASLGDKGGKNAFVVDHVNSKIKIARDVGFELGAATDKMMLGSSFRQAQQQMHSQLMAQLKTIQQQQAAIGALLSAAVSTVPGAPLPQVQSAGALFQAVAQAAGAAAQAIQAFEQAASQKTNFLSDKDLIG